MFASVHVCEWGSEEWEGQRGIQGESHNINADEKSP